MFTFAAGFIIDGNISVSIYGREETIVGGDREVTMGSGNV